MVTVRICPADQTTGDTASEPVQPIQLSARCAVRSSCVAESGSARLGHDAWSNGGAAGEDHSGEVPRLDPVHEPRCLGGKSRDCISDIESLLFL